MISAGEFKIGSDGKCHVFLPNGAEGPAVPAAQCGPVAAAATPAPGAAPAPAGAPAAPAAPAPVAAPAPGVAAVVGLQSRARNIAGDYRDREVARKQDFSPATPGLTQTMFDAWCNVSFDKGVMWSDDEGKCDDWRLCNYDNNDIVDGRYLFAVDRWGSVEDFVCNGEELNDDATEELNRLLNSMGAEKTGVANWNPYVAKFLAEYLPTILLVNEHGTQQHAYKIREHVHGLANQSIQPEVVDNFLMMAMVGSVDDAQWAGLATKSYGNDFMTPVIAANAAMQKFFYSLFPFDRDGKSALSDIMNNVMGVVKEAMKVQPPQPIDVEALAVAAVLASLSAVPDAAALATLETLVQNAEHFSKKAKERCPKCNHQGVIFAGLSSQEGEIAIARKILDVLQGKPQPAAAQPPAASAAPAKRAARIDRPRAPQAPKAPRAPRAPQHDDGQGHDVKKRPKAPAADEEVIDNPWS